MLHKAAKKIAALRGKVPAPVYTALRKAYQLVKIWWQPPQSIVVRAYVAALNDDAPLQPTQVLYESFHGKSFNCSPAAICMALLDDPAYAHLTHIWAVNDPAVLPASLTAHPNLRWVKRDDPAYGTALATAGTVISNTTLDSFFTRRAGQVYANTWHGVPLKKMFRFEGTALTRHANSQRNFLQASHLLMPNAFTADALMEGADVSQAVGDTVYTIGAPRVDLTLKTDRAALREKLGIAPDCQVIMVAPTWRGTIGAAQPASAEINTLLSQLNALDRDRYVTFVQMHDFVARPNTRARGLPADLTTNQFLAVVDILITDYSSIMFDMFATGRQVVLFPYDLDDYRATRGLIADLDSLPAPVCMDPDAVIAAVLSGQRSDSDPRFAAARDRYFPQDDGQATQRAIAQIFAPPAPARATQRPRILVAGGAWKNNGITSSALNLLDALAAYDVDIYVVTHGTIIDDTPEYAANLRRLHPSVHVIHRAGPLVATAQEHSALHAFYQAQRFQDDAQEQTIRNLCTRESRRLFGDMTFDVAIDFSGYSRFWALVIAATKAKRHVIYQHNDMLSEAQLRFDVLYGVFATYKYFDAIAAVSPATLALNKTNLVQYYASPDCAVSVRNMIDPAQIIAQSHAPLPADITLPKGPRRFVSVGRQSSEKAQERMIAAVAKLRDEGHDVELVLIGDGPLAPALRLAARKAGVADHVIFAGQQANPFAIIARCDCFVLSSDYEGQPMVLLEALCLGLPIVATDIAGTRSVLDPKQSKLVTPDTAGVTAGMRDYLLGATGPQKFDSAAYCETVMQEFSERVLALPLPSTS